MRKRPSSRSVSYELRQTAASLAIASGADIKVVQQTLRHMSATVGRHQPAPSDVGDIDTEDVAVPVARSFEGSRDGRHHILATRWSVKDSHTTSPDLSATKAA